MPPGQRRFQNWQGRWRNGLEERYPDTNTQRASNDVRLYQALLPDPSSERFQSLGVRDSIHVELHRLVYIEQSRLPTSNFLDPHANAVTTDIVINSICHRLTRSHPKARRPLFSLPSAQKRIERLQSHCELHRVDRVQRRARQER